VGGGSYRDKLDVAIVLRCLTLYYTNIGISLSHSRLKSNMKLSFSYYVYHNLTLPPFDRSSMRSSMPLQSLLSRLYLERRHLLLAPRSLQYSRHSIFLIRLLSQSISTRHPCFLSSRRQSCSFCVNRRSVCIVYLSLTECLHLAAGRQVNALSGFCRLLIGLLTFTNISTLRLSKISR